MAESFLHNILPIGIIIDDNSSGEASGHAQHD